MCSLLKISRNACYYTKKEKKCDTELENEIIRIFRSSRDCYGTRKIKRALGGRAVSRRYIANVMKKYGLVSKYTQRQLKRHKSVVNEENVPNVVNREFSNRERLEVVVSDLTYVRVGNEWNYVCLIIDLHNREIIGKACGRRKEAALAELADSIRQHGIIQPLTVRRLSSGYYQIIAGERRWRAARLAGLSEVPVTVIEADDRKAAELAMIENLQREDLNPMEEAAGYRTLIQDYGLTQEEAAQRVSKSRPAVS